MNESSASSGGSRSLWPRATAWSCTIYLLLILALWATLRLCADVYWPGTVLLFSSGLDLCTAPCTTGCRGSDLAPTATLHAGCDGIRDSVPGHGLPASTSRLGDQWAAAANLDVQ